MPPAKREAVVPKELVDQLLVAAGENLVLVGGQALKLWMDRYRVKLPARMAYVSRDVEFLPSLLPTPHPFADSLGLSAVEPSSRSDGRR